MSQVTSGRPPVLSGLRLSRQSHLRLVRNRQATDLSVTGQPTVEANPPDQRQGEDHVLVAGADAPTRARMLAELRSVLPEGTHFVEASETWEVVARAADSRMVVLAGDLGEASSSSLLRLLARRNPALPVLAVGDSERRQALDAAHA